MQSNTPKELVYQVTGDQGFKICLQVDAAQALLFLLATALEASAEPTKEESRGLLMLVASVETNLNDAVDSVFRPKLASETSSQNVA